MPNLSPDAITKPSRPELTRLETLGLGPEVEKPNEVFFPEPPASAGKQCHHGEAPMIIESPVFRFARGCHSRYVHDTFSGPQVPEYLTDLTAKHGQTQSPQAPLFTN
ncbi:hypothetical protein MKZ38_001568 [Zalerion maritima]|uniref:Uncharacterized protein n=1 Tax=Zalerion maritima TaxID=339359 RepID=A0AAD5RXT4_9PEZI|nr:hypothetical protein MKZ38_001568 [Zalerion maritima]